MSVYSIADLEKLSGIKAHTLRIWEKRYNIVEPNRTDTNIRFYNDVQLKKILNISFLINQGFKISKLAILNAENLANKVKENSAVSSSYESHINNMIISSLTFDGPLFNSTFEKAITSLGLSKTYESIIIPSLNKIGSLWSSGELFPAQEHFLSNLIKQKLYAILDNVTPDTQISKSILLFLPPWESHDFALLYADILFKQRGLNVINTGRSISEDSIYECIEKIKPDYLFTTVIVGHKVTEIQEFCDGISSHNSNGKFLLAGNINLLKLVSTKATIFNSCSEFEMYINTQIK